MAGDLHEILIALQEEPNPHYRLELPQNLEEYYTKEYLKRRPEPRIRKDFRTHKDTYESYLMSAMAGTLDYGEDAIGEEDDEEYEDNFVYQPVQKTPPIVRAEKKVGHNDPCPLWQREEI